MKHQGLIEAKRARIHEKNGLPPERNTLNYKYCIGCCYMKINSVIDSYKAAKAS